MLEEIFRKSTAAQVIDGTSPRVPMRERTPESVNRKIDGWRLAEQLLPTYRDPTCHLEMTVRALVMTEAYREGAVGRIIWSHQKH